MNELYHGDCLEVMRTIPSTSVDLIVTDPPYGINYKSSAQTENRRTPGRPQGSKVREAGYFKEILNDDVVPTEWLADAFRVTKTGGAIYIYCHWRGWPEMSRAVQDAGFQIKNMIVMNKSNHGMGDLNGSYAPKHELLLFAVKGKHKLRWPNGRGKDVWDVKVKFSGAHHFHPNEKPLSWMEPAILNSSDIGNTVLDPFCGSASTGAACVSTNRNFIGIEKDETFFNIAQERIGLQTEPKCEFD